MVRLFAVLAFVCLAGSALAENATPKAAAPDPAARAYTEKVAAGLAAKMPDSKFTVVGDFRIRQTEPDGRGELLMSTFNHYNEYKADPANLGKIIDAAAAAIAARESVGTGKLDIERIVPVIKDRGWLEERRRAANAERAAQIDFLHEDYNEQLVVVYARATENRMNYLVAGKGACDCSALRARAVKNLSRLLPKIEMETFGSVSMFSAGGEYEASLLLFDDMWRGGQIKVNGDIVVAIPAKHTLMVAGSKDRKGVTTLRELAAKFFAESRDGITDSLFVYRDGRFVKYEQD